MRARGNTSSEASLVQCLCNSHGLGVVGAATIGSRLFPSLMPPLALVISSSFDIGNVLTDRLPKSTTVF